MKTITLSPSTAKQALQEAVTILKNGGLVLYPTETVYGVAVDATHKEAVSKLLAFKNRPAGKAISILVSDTKMAEKYVEINDLAKNLYKTFLPGPFTIISKVKGGVDPRLVSEFGTLGIRISSHHLAQALVKAANTALTATSANASGKARPYSIEKALSGLSEHQKSLIDLVLDAGELPHNEPSTVIDTTTEVQEIVRAGSGFGDSVQTKITHSTEETIQFATDLFKSLAHVLPEKPLVLALEGDMGAGKTHFAKGIAKALEIKVPVTSPTYTLQKEYSGAHNDLPVKMLHMDLWRLDSVVPEDLGITDHLRPGSIMVIEWAGPLLPFLKSHDNEIVAYQIQIKDLGHDSRQISIFSL